MPSQESPAIVDKVPYKALPREVLARVGLHGLLRDLLATLALLVVLNFAARWYLSEYTTNYGYWMIYQKWKLLTRLDAPVDWLILGDSSCNQGVIPALFESELGETGLNLCTIGNMTALEDLWMLEEYIQRFGPPENVLIVHVYDMWWRDFDPALLARIPLPWGYWQDFSLSEQVVGGVPRGTLFLQSYVPLYSQNATVGDILRKTLLLQANPFASPWQLDQAGFLPAYESRQESVELDTKRHIEFVSQNASSFSEINRAALERIFALADRHGFQVYLAMSPVYEGLYADEAYQAYLGDVQAQLASFAAQSQYVHFIPAVKTFPAGQMQNADHLVLSGAQEYTRWLIGEINWLEKR